jgi:hypothetical protein
VRALEVLQIIQRSIDADIKRANVAYCWCVFQKKSVKATPKKEKYEFLKGNGNKSEKR